MIGTCGSLVNTYIFEIYLAKSMHKETTQMSTGSTWRYLVAVIACVLWLFFKEHINIIGVLIVNDFLYCNHIAPSTTKGVKFNRKR